MNTGTNIFRDSIRHSNTLQKPILIPHTGVCVQDKVSSVKEMTRVKGSPVNVLVFFGANQHFLIAPQKYIIKK